MTNLGSVRPLRWFGGVALAACVLRVWHVLLMRQLLDAPFVMAAWLAFAFVLVIVVVRPGRAGVFGAALLLTIVFLFHWGYERAASDGREYFVQARSLVIDRDLDLSNENASFGVRGTASIYPFGAAILWAPFMFLAHVWLWILNLFGASHPLDGFSNPYQRAIGLGTLVYGVCGLMLVRRMLRDYFDDGIADITTVCICFGSFFLWYLTIENSMAHGVSMFATTLFLFVWHRGRQQPAGFVLGLAAGLMAMTRWQNVVFIAAPIAIAVYGAWRARQPAIRGLVLFGAGAVLAFSPQLIFWKVVRGSWFALPTGEHAFDLASLHVADVLFSPNHGLLSSTPMLYGALLGVPLFFRRDVPLALVLTAGLVGQVLVNAGVDTWWGSAGFGARRFDNCLLLFAVGFASVLVWCRRRPLAAPLALVGVLIAGNLALMQDVRSRRLPSGEGITFAEMVEAIHRRVGNPFSFPYSAYVAWQYDATPALYDRLKGRTYNNVEIDFGTEGDDLFLGYGWLGPERSETTTFRWATGTASSIVVPLSTGDAYRLELVCEAFAPPGQPPQTVDVVINRTRVARVALGPGRQSYQINIPARTLRRDLNSIRLIYAYSISPSVAGVGNDARSLSVMFDLIRLTRVAGQ